MSLSILTIFGAGILSVASPCVLPMLPVYFASLVGASLESAGLRRVLPASAAFALGLSVVFVALGALASSFGAVLLEHRLWITLASGGLMIVFGLRTVGLMRIAALDREARPALARVRVTSGLAGSFLFGAAFALGWSPCIGPVLSSVLVFSATRANSPWLGAGYLAVYAAGFSLPLLAAAAIASRAPQALAMARRAVPRLELATGTALLVFGFWTVASSTHSLAPRMLRPTMAGGTSCAPVDERGDAPPVCTLATTAVDAAESTMNPSGLAGPRILEFGSDSCPACRRIQPVLANLANACAEVSDLMVHVDVATAAGLEAARRHAVIGTPTIVFMDSRGREQVRLVGEVAVDELAAAVERTFGYSCALAG